MNLEREIKKNANTEKSRLKDEDSLNTWKLLETASPFLLVVNLPLAIAVGIAGVAGDYISQNKKLNENEMPDEWLKKVSELKVLSKEGLKFLVDNHTNKGYTSVNDALSFIEIEKEMNKQYKKINADDFSYKDDYSSSIGIMALNERYNKDNLVSYKLKGKGKLKKAVNVFVDVAPKVFSMVLSLKAAKTMKAAQVGKRIVKK